MQGIISMARAGRNGDTTMAHMTPGEMVIPREVAALRPDLVAHVEEGIRSMGGDPLKYVVGRGRKNPKTGAEEFASQEEIIAAYQSALNRTPGQSEIDYWAKPENNFGASFNTGVQAELASRTPAPNNGIISSAASPAVDWGNVYRNNAGRDATTAETDFWNQRAGAIGADNAYKEFQSGLTANKEVNRGMDLASASKAYNGPTSANSGSVLDDWTRNVLGRAATADDYTKYADLGTPEAAQNTYSRFLADARAAGVNVNDMSLAQASQLTGQQNRPNSAGGGGIINAAQLGSPTPWNVTDEQTVEGRINRLTDPNSPIIQQARTRALQFANQRGLLNSSIASTAADSAAYEAAIPIAQADAATYAKAAGYNADQSNQFAARNAEMDNQMRLAQLNADTQTKIAQLNVDAQTQANTVADANKKLLETNSQAAQAFNTAMSAINNIQNNNQMDADTKTRGVSSVWRDLQTQLNVLGTVAGLNLTSALNFANYPGFDAQGRWVGFEDGPGAVTRGTAPPPAPAATPAPAPYVANTY